MNLSTDAKNDGALKVVRIMEELCRSGTSLSLREIESRTAVPRSTVHRLLNTLEGAHWVSRDADDHFRVGLSFCLLGHRHALLDGLIAQATQPMRELAEKTSKTVLLSLLDGLKGLCVHTEEPELAVKFVARRGMTIPLCAGATGKVLLAFAPKALRDKVLNQPLVLPDGSVGDANQLRQDLEAIAVQGYSFSQEEWIAHAADLSVPLCDHGGTFVAQLGLAGLAGTFEPHFDELLEALRETARRISKHV